MPETQMVDFLEQAYLLEGFVEEGEEGENEEKNEIEQLELTSDELKKIDGVQFNRNERNELDKYTVNEQEELIAKNA